MTVKFIALALALVAAFQTTRATAASSGRVDVEGASIRLFVSSGRDGSDALLGALSVDLEPGWKTYWREPGGSGVPPSIEVSADHIPVPTEIGFPAPRRHGEGGDIWAGYDAPVDFTLSIRAPSRARNLTASVFLGVCRDICIPVKAQFEVALDQLSDAEDERTVTEAFARLPGIPREGFKVLGATISNDSLEIAVDTPPQDRSPDLFLASPDGPVFGTPDSERQGQQIIFRVPLLSSLSAKGRTVHYTLTAGTEAVAGEVLVGN